MTPLDLRTRAPRSGNLELGGIIFLPRSIDKLRAALPGGQLGLYTLDGLTEWMLERLGLEREAALAFVADAADEDEIVAWVLSAAKPGGVEAWNDFVRDRRPFGGDREKSLAIYPWIGDGELPRTLDALDEDDRRLFAP